MLQFHLNTLSCCRQTSTELAPTKFVPGDVDPRATTCRACAGVILLTVGADPYVNAFVLVAVPFGVTT